MKPFLLKSLCLATMSLWVGGFSFYGAGVVPVLHDFLDSLTTGTISRDVTHALNLIGLITLTPWWLLLAFKSSSPLRDFPRRRALALACWILSATLLALLALLHHDMSARLDSGRLSGFYPFHRAYLIASTIQFAANLTLLITLFTPPQPRSLSNHPTP